MQIMIGRNVIFRQLFDRTSCTYTYLLGDPITRNALLIDPVLELVSRDIDLIKELDVKLKYVMNTHVHADHVTGTGEIKKRLSIEGSPPLSIISRSSGAVADHFVEDGDFISCGDSIKLEVRATPGHTSGCVTYVDHDNNMAFTGDALLIRGCGRTDFQEGSAPTLYKSVHSKILSLPDHFKLFPAHDYKGFTSTTVYEEKHFNPRLSKSEEEFITIMNNLGLDYPKMIDIAVPRNLLCGDQPSSSKN